MLRISKMLNDMPILFTGLQLQRELKNKWELGAESKLNKILT